MGFCKYRKTDGPDELASLDKNVVGSEALISVVTKISLFLDITPCNLLKANPTDYMAL
jgi:hypothetical protein